MSLGISLARYYSALSSLPGLIKMVVFGRRFDWTFLTCSAVLLFLNLIGHVTTAYAQQSKQPDVQDSRTSAEADFDAFLDAHPEIDAQLRTNPSLINDQKWVQDHREVLAYFDHHPEVKNEIAGSPSYLIRRESRRLSREAHERSDNLRKEEIANFKQFLNFNPQISKQLNADPGLIKEPRYLGEHPGLQAYLYDHPLINKDLREDPGSFLQRESQQNDPIKKGTEDQKVQGPEKQADSHAPAYVANREQVAHDQRQAIDSGPVRTQTEQPEARPSGLRSSPASDEIAAFDRFLDRHPEISQQLSSNPSLIGNSQYLEQHPGLRAYLVDHPSVSKEIAETPNYFVRREVQTPYDALEARRTLDSGTIQMAGSPSSERQRTTSNAVLTPSEIAGFDHFLSEHKKVNKDLERNPERIKDADYLKKHKDLQDYLEQHTGLREELAQYPAYFMNRRNRYELSVAERTIDTRSSGGANSASSIARLSQKDLRAADRFLEKHKNIYKDLEKNPSLVADAHYLKRHKDFRGFLEQNPDINAAMRTDPMQFMRNQHDRFERMHQKM